MQVIPKKLFTITHNLLTLISFKIDEFPSSFCIFFTVLLETLWRSLYGRVHYFVNYCSTNENSSKQSQSRIEQSTHSGGSLLKESVFLNESDEKWLKWFTPVMCRLTCKHRQAKLWNRTKFLEWIWALLKCCSANHIQVLELDLLYITILISHNI